MLAVPLVCLISKNAKVLLKYARSKDALQEQEELLVSVLPMEVVEGVRESAVTREQKAKPSSARRMVVVDDAITLAVPKVQKVVPISAYLMVVAEDACTMVALAHREVNLDCAYAMEVGKGARLRVAHEAPRATLAYAYPMEVVAVANTLGAQRGLKVARCSAKLTVEAEGARSWAAQKVRKGVPRFAKAMVVAKDVLLRDARRVFMVGLYFV